MTAERIRVIVQQFYDHAIRNLLVTTNPAQPLRGAIVRAPVRHHRHLSETELGAFWRTLDEQGAHVTTIAASKLLMLTLARKSELLRSKWAEFDLDAAQRDLPPERKKMGNSGELNRRDVCRRAMTRLGRPVQPTRQAEPRQI